jgi:Polymer-forming cytoskeletal
VLPRAWCVAASLVLLALAAPAAAQAAGAEGHDDDAIVVISGDVAVPRGEVVDGVYIASGDARIAGRVDGDVVVFSGDVTLAGTIDGNLVVTDGVARLLPRARVTGDIHYGDEQPVLAPGARVRGDIEEADWGDFDGLGVFIGFFAFWLAIGVSAALLGALLLLIAPRAADAIYAQARGRIGPVIAIGIAIGIVLPVLVVLAAITLVGLPLAIGLGLALLPIAAVAYVASAWTLGRAIVKPPRNRALSFLAGLAILRLLALIPVLGLLVGLAAVVFGLGLIGAAIGAAREPRSPAAAQTLGS